MCYVQVAILRSIREKARMSGKSKIANSQSLGGFMELKLTVNQ